MNLTKEAQNLYTKTITQNNCWKKWRIIYIDEKILQVYRSENIKMAMKANVVQLCPTLCNPRE